MVDGAVTVADGILCAGDYGRIDIVLCGAGGIVQGMSGSPIVQDGRFIGAVTHVLVRDPTRGYGILIGHMLEAADQAAFAA